MTKTKTPKPSKPSTTTSSATDAAKSWREAVESIVIAIVLAFLFRAFEAEAFVIPTGSMAPTLQGRHKDLECPQCGFRYQTGASLEAEMQYGPVEAAMCPACRYTQALDLGSSAHVSHTGDRILVNKFAYEPPFGDPQRWDVIVFKYPGNAKQNYIKRCVGLENETIKINHGDVFVRKADNDRTSVDGEFQIARKPPHKLKHLLQLVHDTRYLSSALQQLDWPLNWQARGGSEGWSSPDQGSTYVCEATGETAWLDFRQYYLSFVEWEQLGEKAAGQQAPLSGTSPIEVPVTDFYAYNAQTHRLMGHSDRFNHPVPVGKHWVGDLAVEVDLEVMHHEAGGLIELVLVESGRHHSCQIDLTTGRATLRINDGKLAFIGAEGEGQSEVTAETAIRGAGDYKLRFSNVDDQLLLWVDDDLCKFNHATTYRPDSLDRPHTSSAEPGDLHPVRIGAKNAALSVGRMRVLRDVYYIATSTQRRSATDYSSFVGDDRIVYHLTHPEEWRKGDIFDERATVSFTMDDDQFFALGDNSPYSKDGRLWEEEHYVARDMLIGKAVLIYWPHAWRISIPGTHISLPIIPNPQGIGLIH
jgi:signal peptidase I